MLASQLDAPPVLVGVVVVGVVVVGVVVVVVTSPPQLQASTYLSFVVAALPSSHDDHTVFNAVPSLHIDVEVVVVVFVGVVVVVVVVSSSPNKSARIDPRSSFPAVGAVATSHESVDCAL